MKKNNTLLLGVTLLCLFSGCGSNEQSSSTETSQSISIEEQNYLDASTFFDEGDYFSAAEKFNAAGSYQDSATRTMESIDLYMDSTLDYGPEFASLLLELGEQNLFDDVGHTMRSNNTSVVATGGGNHFIAILPDGTVSTTVELHNPSEWTDIVSVSIFKSAGIFSGDTNHVVGLKANGTVVASGYNKENQCMVGEWRDIVMIATAEDLTIGLSSTGEIFLAGEIELEDLNKDYILPVIDNWNRWGTVKKIYADGYHIVVMTSNGRCSMTDNYHFGMSHAVETVSSASTSKGFIDFSMGAHHYVGLYEDGTVYADGRNENWELDVDSWSDIVQVVASSDPYLLASIGYCAGLKSDGTVVMSGDNQALKSEVANWTDVVFLAAGTEGHMLLGVRSDGTLLTAEVSAKVQPSLDAITSVKLPT